MAHHSYFILNNALFTHLSSCCRIYHCRNRAFTVTTVFLVRITRMRKRRTKPEVRLNSRSASCLRSMTSRRRRIIYTRRVLICTSVTTLCQVIMHCCALETCSNTVYKCLHDAKLVLRVILHFAVHIYWWACVIVSESEQFRRKVEGGALQLTLFKLCFDFYPFHLAGAYRMWRLRRGSCHWPSVLYLWF